MEQEEVRSGKVGWTCEEDYKLRVYVNTHGPHHWDTMATNLGIGRSGNSCRLRWVNYLSPHIRRGDFSDEEVLIVLNLHRQFGNRWAKIAKELRGRTDNDIKNLWNTRLVKEAKQLNCEVTSEEFFMIMTARLKERMGDTTATSFSTHAVDVPSNKELSDDDYGPIPDDFWANLGSICDLGHDFPWDG